MLTIVILRIRGVIKQKSITFKVQYFIFLANFFRCYGGRKFLLDYTSILFNLDYITTQLAQETQTLTSTAILSFDYKFSHSLMRLSHLTSQNLSNMESGLRYQYQIIKEHCTLHFLPCFFSKSIDVRFIYFGSEDMCIPDRTINFSSNNKLFVNDAKLPLMPQLHSCHNI